MVGIASQAQLPIWHAIHNNTPDGVAMLDLLTANGADVLACNTSEVWDGVFWSFDTQGRTAMVQWLLDKGVAVEGTAFIKSLENWLTDDEATETAKLLNNALRIDWTSQEARDRYYPPLAQHKMLKRLLHVLPIDINARYRDTSYVECPEISYLFNYNLCRGMGGRTLLHSAGTASRNVRDTVPRGSPLVTLLIEGGADVNARDESGATPLHYYQKVKDIASLVARGASVNAQTNDGLTWLHLRMRSPPEEWPNVATLEEMDKLGFDFSARDAKGKSAVPVDLQRAEGIPSAKLVLDWLLARCGRSQVEADVVQ